MRGNTLNMPPQIIVKYLRHISTQSILCEVATLLVCLSSFFGWRVWTKVNKKTQHSQVNLQKYTRKHEDTCNRTQTRKLEQGDPTPPNLF